MDDFVRQWGKWIQIQTYIIGHSEMLEAGIVLKDNSLSQGYLYFKLRDSVIACFPIDNIMRTEIIECITERIYFPTYDNYTIELMCSLLTSLNLLHTQVELCAKISCNVDDPFQEQNEAFLKENGKKIEEFPKNSNIIPLFPLESCPQARITWFNRTIMQNRPYFIIPKDLNVLCYTWNVASTPPNSDTFQLAKWIFDQNADIVFIALEEIDFSAGAVIFGGSERLEQWSDCFDEASKEKSYQLIYSESLGGVLFYLMKRKDLENNVELTYNNLIRLGAGGIAANKSAIVATINVDDAKIGFIAAHLTPHDEHYEDRNQQVHFILDSIQDQKLDYTFFAGDLNYRVEVPYEETIEKISQNQLDYLLEHEQLNRFKTESPRMAEFYEAPITFAPTYKFDQDSEVYDTSKKHRIPSWTDRVLVRTASPNRAVGPVDTLAFETDIIRHMNFKYGFRGESCFTTDLPPNNYPSQPVCDGYERHDIKFSDHRPVSAKYRVPIESLDKERFTKFEEIRNQKMDELVDISIPRCKIEPASFETTGESEITITNNSCSISMWKAELIPSDTILQPSQGIIMPTKSQNVKLITKTGSTDIQVVMINIEGGSPAAFEFWKAK